LKGVQSFRPVSVQNFLEQETQRTENEAVVSALVGEDVIPSEMSANSTTFQPAVEPACEQSGGQLHFREIFAGQARLTRELKKLVNVRALIKRASKSRGPQKILDDSFFEQLKHEAQQPRQLGHFELPCGSFSILQHSNGGTRRKNRLQHVSWKGMRYFVELLSLLTFWLVRGIGGP